MISIERYALHNLGCTISTNTAPPSAFIFPFLSVIFPSGIQRNMNILYKKKAQKDNSPNKKGYLVVVHVLEKR